MFQKKRAKVLYLDDVEIGAWPEQNFLFGILGQQKCGTDWIMNHFIQLRGAHYISHRWGANDASVTFYPYSIHQLTPNMFDLCPFINKYTIPKSFIQSMYGVLHKFVIEAIDAGFYISTFLDQFFRKDIGGNYGFRHPAFIYGYDMRRHVIFIADNFENGKYGRKEITFQQLDRGFELVSAELWEVSVFLYKVVPFRFEFVPEYVKEQLEDYLEPGRGVCYLNRTICPENLHDDEDYLNEVFFGIQCYDLLAQCLEGILEGDSGYSNHDWRSFVQLRDHKHLMLKRYEYLIKNGYISGDNLLYKELQEIEKQCIIAQNMYIKYTLSGDDKIIRRLRERLGQIRERDVWCMERMLKNI